MITPLMYAFLVLATAVTTWDGAHVCKDRALFNVPVLLVGILVEVAAR